ncbi:hypothetical protein [Halostagnicola kamekurae]|uniref:Uncharacterized protein n=1 Tax=Halostagnicola kamekurae TaxID=619731 RepID=A0A1I6RMH8_9EURY|nr:hypothetical protein [Halostagnicola kamekurae]SFS65810.1 hypothetical protein SAMN04488556_1902 [Halostagnicola kamekurae]
MTDQHVSQQRTEQQHEYDERSGFTYGVKRRLTSASWLARAASVGLSSVSIGFVMLFMFVLETGGDLTLFTRPLPMQIALTLPYLIGALTLGTTVGAMLAWRYRYWSLTTRIHQTVLALLGLAFSWQLSTLGFLGL